MVTTFSINFQTPPRHPFQKTVHLHGGDHRVRTLPFQVQLVSLTFAQMTGRASLRDLEENFNAKHNHHYHLGVKGIRHKLPILPGATYVVDRAYNDCSGYFS